MVRSARASDVAECFEVEYPRVVKQLQKSRISLSLSGVFSQVTNQVIPPPFATDPRLILTHRTGI